MRGRARSRRARIHRPGVAEDVERELRAHLEQRAEELVAAGWGEAEAREEAARLFGDRAAVAAECREIAAITRRRKDRSSMLEALWRDVRWGARTLVASPGFTVLAVLTLALGVGANTAAFSAVSGVLLRQPPYPDAERLVVLHEVNESGREISVTRPNFDDFVRQATSFEGLAAYPGGRYETTVLGGVQPVRAVISPVSGSFFPLMGVAPFLGRTFGPEDSRLDQPPVVVVSHGFWRDALGSPSALEGVTLRAGGARADVVGVMPPSFDFPVGTDVWFPRGLTPDNSTRTAHNLGVVGRLRGDVPLAAAQAEMSAIAARLAEEYAGNINAVDVRVRPLREDRAGDARPSLLLLLGAAGFVLLIACANLASGLLARGTARVREAAVRSALGAGRARIVRQLLTENLLLAGAGGASGLVVGWLLIRALVHLYPEALPAGTSVALDPYVLGFALGVTVLTALLFGIGPAIRLARTPPAALVRADSGRASRAMRAGHWYALIGAEVALALILLVGAGLLVRSFSRLTAVDPGYDIHDVLTATIALPSEAYPDDASVSAALGSVREALAAIPGVTTVGGAHELPLATGGMDGSMEVEGRAEPGYAEYRVVLPGYFAALDIGTIAGRVFSVEDRYGGPAVAVVNRSLAEEYWPGEEAVGKRVRGTTNDPYTDEWLTVIGVIDDIRHRSVLAEPGRELYVSALQRPNRASFLTFTLETEGPPASLAGAVRDVIGNAAPQAPAELRTFADVARRDIMDRSFVLAVLGLFSALAVLLAALGIYGVVAYTVGRRTREIGIRIALGARPAAVLRALQREMAIPVVAGLVVGLVGAVFLTRLLGGMLYDVRPLDTPTFAAVTAGLLLVAWLASWVPARRATQVAPVDALSAE